MKTEFVKIDYEKPISPQLAGAAKILAEGGLVAFPTETVYGLGGNALNADAAKHIYAAKGRPSDNPLIVHIARPSDAAKYAVKNMFKKKILIVPGKLVKLGVFFQRFVPTKLLLSISYNIQKRKS